MLLGTVAPSVHENFFQSKANLDGKILFGKNTRFYDLKIRKMSVRGMYGNENSTFHAGPWFTCY